LEKFELEASYFFSVIYMEVKVKGGTKLKELNHKDNEGE
jgi:hypothetical protein